MHQKGRDSVGNNRDDPASTGAQQAMLQQHGVLLVRREKTFLLYITPTAHVADKKQALDVALALPCYVIPMQLPALIDHGAACDARVLLTFKTQPKAGYKNTAALNFQFRICKIRRRVLKSRGKVLHFFLLVQKPGLNPNYQAVSHRSKMIRATVCLPASPASFPANCAYPLAPIPYTADPGS
jgi:hypothetical protein